VQLGTELQVGQLSGVPATLYRPAAQMVHWPLPAPVQVGAAAHPVMGAHAEQPRSLPLVQAVVS
jgi:hypothetical protein